MKRATKALSKAFGPTLFNSKTNVARRRAELQRLVDALADRALFGLAGPRSGHAAARGKASSSSSDFSSSVLGDDVDEETLAQIALTASSPPPGAFGKCAAEDDDDNGSSPCSPAEAAATADEEDDGLHSLPTPSSQGSVTVLTPRGYGDEGRRPTMKEAAKTAFGSLALLPGPMPSSPDDDDSECSDFESSAKPIGGGSPSKRLNRRDSRRL